MVGRGDNPYEILGLTQGADERQIRAAYKQLAKDLHPDIHLESRDRVANEEHLKRVNAAYRQLKKGFTGETGSGRKVTQAKRREPVSSGSAAQDANGTRNAEEESRRYWAAYHKAKKG